MEITKIIFLLCLSCSTTFAADCGAEGQQFYESVAVTMMWSIRAWVCPNAWWQSITAGPQGDWCDPSGPFTYSGSWTIAGVASEQQCWDITEQIINQCMYAEYHTDNQFHVNNGGTWTYGSTYAGGWFWVDNQGTCQHSVSGKVRKDEAATFNANTPANYTLSSGETVPVDRRVWLDLSDPADVKVVADVKYN